MTIEETRRRLNKEKTERIEKRSNPDYVFQQSRSCIEELMGIELSLIELVRLKELAIESVNRNIKVKKSWSLADPDQDTIQRFLHDYYDIPYAGKAIYHVLIGRSEFKQKHGYDGYQEFWKKKQEQAHLP